VATDSLLVPDESVLPLAHIKTEPEDFVVEEIAAYEPSGEGDHVFVDFRKRGLNSTEAVRRLADWLGVDPRSAGLAGRKDRHAVTRQRASFLMPIPKDGCALPASLASCPEGIEVIELKRHRHKLKTGHLQGNRFTLVLRQVADDAFEPIESHLRRMTETGVPNAFGAQRFGRHGDNAERALAWLQGQGRGPRDKKKRRFLFSALQSKLFNDTLAQRVHDGSWNRVLLGDLAKKRSTGGLFEVDEDCLADAEQRAARGEICATGPIFGAKMRWPGATVGSLERAVLEGAMDPQILEDNRRLGEGSRRPLRLWVSDLSWELDPGQGMIRMKFVLPKGAYATTVLSNCCRVIDGSGALDARQILDKVPGR
jgi:tRNA pseudouridine13 synthase